jgi:hypothetical protein
MKADEPAPTLLSYGYSFDLSSATLYYRYIQY